MPCDKVWHDVDTFLMRVVRKTKPRYISQRHQHDKIIRIGSGFDIETTRIETKAYMWCWQFAWDDQVLICRHWHDLSKLIAGIDRFLTWRSAVLIVWVANLGHEFAFLGRRYDWCRLFAVDSHNPLIAQTGRVQFRECLSISGGGGLQNLAENYTTTKKMTGDLDYTVIRNSQTAMTAKEEQYCINDVVILSEWAQYLFETYSDKGQDIPLTSTGIVRNEIKKAAYKTGHIDDIRAAIRCMFPDEQRYNEIMRYLFRGGYCHSSAWWSSIKTDDVVGVDFKSSYPAVMLHDYYPVTPFTECDLRTDGIYITDDNIRSRCCYFMCDIYDIEMNSIHTVESEHKIIKYTAAKFDNGRLRSAKKIRVMLTEIDYQIYCMFYTWSRLEIVWSYCAERGPLPEYVLHPMRDAFILKETMDRSSIEYLNIKAIVNSYYGCMVQRLVFEDWHYNKVTGEWKSEHTKKTYRQMICKLLLSPWWGIYVTAHARHHLLLTVHKMDPDASCSNVLYCDTDSIYFKDSERCRQLVQEYNDRILRVNRETLPAEFSRIGCFDWIDDEPDGSPVHYEFKTIGAKRYIKFYHDEFDVTVAGMRKQSYQNLMCRKFMTDNPCVIYCDKDGKKLGYLDINEMFDQFDDGMLLNSTQSEKNRAVYNPTGHSNLVTDAAGRTEVMCEWSSAAIVPVSFEIKMDDVYIEMLEWILEHRRLPV